jgi:hypothetical protein
MIIAFGPAVPCLIMPSSARQRRDLEATTPIEESRTELIADDGPGSSFTGYSSGSPAAVSQPSFSGWQRKLRRT